MQEEWPVSLAGRVALVTGASRGIGRALAVGLARAGADVAVNGVKGASASQRVVDEITSLGRRCVYIQADTGHCNEVEAMVRQVVVTFDRLDILVNNAGRNTTAPFLELTEDEWDLVIRTNLKGYFLCARAAAREMARTRWGRILQISSVRYGQAWPGNAHYCASKGGIEALTRAMALELAPLGIRVNSLAPGTIETDMNRGKLSDSEFRAARIGRIPVGRLGTPSDLVAAAVLLVSDAADFINGATLVVDGGQTIW